MKKLFLFFQDFINLFYPITCYVCGKNLLKQEKAVCTRCLYHMPKTNYHNITDNPVSKIFWGRTNIENATALYTYKKGSSYQKLIHQLKYQGGKEIGFEMGKLLGSYLQNSDFKNIDSIIPVPLHKQKERKRGYNQSQLIAEGIAKSLNKPVENNSLIRKVASETQTKKNRFDRWENVENIFSLRNITNIENKHILLVDDVVTTGSTLDACAQAITKAKGVKISIATLAVAEM